MTRRWTGVMLMAWLGMTVTARAQTPPLGSGPAPLPPAASMPGQLPPMGSGTPTMTPEPVPFGPGAGGPMPAQQLVPPADPNPSPLSLSGEIPNAWDRPPAPSDSDPRLYFSFEYLLLFVNKDALYTPLVTTTTADPPDITRNFGAFYQRDTVSLFGGDGLSHGGLNGARFTFGMAPEYFLPFEFSIYGVDGSKKSKFASDEDGFPMLARPVTAANLPRNQEVSYLASFPNLARGGVFVGTRTKFWGLDANVFAEPLVNILDFNGYAVDLTFGFRYLSEMEDLRITSSVHSLDRRLLVNFNGGVIGQEDIVGVKDVFITQNVFRGGTIGSRATFGIGPFNVEFKGNLGLGLTYSTIRNSGSTTLYQANGPSVTLPGGILAVPSNSGKYTQDTFTVIPQGAINLELPLTTFLRVWAGYDVMYWSHVARPAAQVNKNIDVRQVVSDIDYSPAVTVTRPAFQFQTTDLWIQGLTAGFAITY